MDEKELKEKLLQTGYFIDNDYLKQYCDLILQNNDQEKIQHETQCHHIIPRHCFTYYNLEIDDSKENLINLFYKDHLLAHYYICLCIISPLKHGLSNAFFHMSFRKYKYDNFNPEEDLNEYQNLYESWIQERAHYTTSEKANLKRSISMKNFYSVKGPYNLTESHKEKISNSMLGKSRDEATKNKISSSWTSKKTSNRQGKSNSKEMNLKISKALKGRVLSESTIQKYHQNKGRAVLCIDNGVIYENTATAIKNTGIKTIGMCCNGQQNSAGGKKWAFVGDEERISFLKEV